MSRVWEFKEKSKRLKLVIEEDENVGFYLLIYPIGSSKSIKDYLCDSLEEALFEALDNYGVLENQWIQIKD